MKLKVICKNGKTENVRISINKVVCAGWTGRNKNELSNHIKELNIIGVPLPKTTPIQISVNKNIIGNLNKINVDHNKTSGEVEYVLLIDNDKIYVTVGSDHTDRLKEKISMEESKKMYQKIIPNTVWYYEDIKDHWDKIIIKSITEYENVNLLYQESELNALLKVESLLDFISTEHVVEKIAIFSGTIPTISGKIYYGNSFKMEIFDPILNRSISHKYDIQVQN